MKALKDNINMVFVLLCELAVGVLLLIDHNAFLSTILMGTGAVLAVCGVAGVVRYMRSSTETAILQHTLGRGLMQLAAGCVLLFGAQWLLGFFSLITSLCGAGLLLVGIMKVQQAADYCRLRLPCWKLSACNAALCLISAVLVMLNPFAVVDTLWMLAAIALIVSAAGDLLVLLTKGRIKR